MALLIAVTILLGCSNAAAIGLMPWHEAPVKVGTDGDSKVTAEEIVDLSRGS